MPRLDTNKHKDLIIMLMALGDAYLEKGLYSEAVKRYNQLLQFKVANRRMYANLSKALIGLKRVDKTAIGIYQTAIQYDANNAEIYEILANSFLEEHREDGEAIRVYELALSQETPSYDKLAEYLATIYFKHQDYIKCKKIAETVLNKRGFQPKALTFFLKSCWTERLFHDAIVQLKRLIDITESNTMLLKYLCRTYLEKKFQSEIQNQNVTFSYIDRQLVIDYLNKVIRFDTLQDLSFYLELKRFLSEKECWGHFVEAVTEKKEKTFAYQALGGSGETTHEIQSLIPESFNLSQEILGKLSFYENLTTAGPQSSSPLTFEDFQKGGAAALNLFSASEPQEESNKFEIADNAEILITIEISNYEQLRSGFGTEHVQTVRKKLFAILTDLVEKYQLNQIWGVSNGLLIFTSEISKAVSISVDLLNKLNRYNFVNEAKDEIHLAIGIHHAREGLSKNGEQSLKDLCTGIKTGVVSEHDLSAEDQPMYGKVFQKTDRLFLSGKAYREVKSLNRFKVNSLGTFRLKYLKENFSLHEVAWRNPIDDLKFGYIKQISRFDLISEIGGEGTIKVYKAKDSTLQRFLILKVIQSETFNSLPPSNPKKLEFYKILKSYGQLSHPNIATIYEVDEDRGLTYIAREFVEGDNIQDTFKKELRFNRERFVKIIYQVFKALQYSHRMGFYHLNLKPNNIRIGPKDDIKLADFFIPRALFDDFANFNKLDNSYQSPEQLHGRSGDNRSDIFSMAVILYQIVTQRHPFLDGKLQNMEDAILQKIPSPASVHNSRVPKFIDALLQKCLEKNPDKRIQTVEEIVSLLKKNFERTLFSNFNYQIARSRDSY